MTRMSRGDHVQYMNNDNNNSNNKMCRIHSTEKGTQVRRCIAITYTVNKLKDQLYTLSGKIYGKCSLTFTVTGASRRSSHTAISSDDSLYYIKGKGN